MPTSFRFTVEQLAQIAIYRTELKDDLDETKHATVTQGGAVKLYGYIFKCVTGIDITNVDALHDALALTTDPNIRQSLIWLYGATQVNSRHECRYYPARRWRYSG
jgi:hypothetical protein